MKYIVLSFLFYLTGYAQISGRIITESAPDLILQTTLLQTGAKTEADFDGYFSIQIPDKLDRYDILIEASSMTLKIENITRIMHNIKLDSIELPVLKNVSVDEYNQAGELEKIKYISVYHWSNIVGYYDKFTLSHNFISFYCNGKEFQTDHIVFDPENRIINIDAKYLINCDN
jgi:hypothetical protein